jgi:membrane-bound acyltransferase YfiQ involved in biofilm formation
MQQVLFFVYFFSIDSIIGAIKKSQIKIIEKYKKMMVTRAWIDSFLLQYYCGINLDYLIRFNK